MENSNNGISLLSAALCSFLTLQVVGDLVRFACSFIHLNCAFTFHLGYHETNDKQQARTQRPPVVDVPWLMPLSAASEFLLPVRIQPGKRPEGEIGSLGTTLLASF